MKKKNPPDLTGQVDSRWPFSTRRVRLKPRAPHKVNAAVHQEILEEIFHFQFLYSQHFASAKMTKTWFSLNRVLLTHFIGQKTHLTERICARWKQRDHQTQFKQPEFAQHLSGATDGSLQHHASLLQCDWVNEHTFHKLNCR